MAFNTFPVLKCLRIQMLITRTDTLLIIQRDILGEAEHFTPFISIFLRYNYRKPFGNVW